MAKDVEKRLYTSSYEVKGIYQQEREVIGLMKDELARKIMKKVAGLRPEMYFYIKLNDKEEGKKANCTKSILQNLKLSSKARKIGQMQVKLRKTQSHKMIVVLLINQKKNIAHP